MSAPEPLSLYTSAQPVDGTTALPSVPGVLRMMPRTKSAGVA